MKKYFRIVFATIITALVVTSSVHAASSCGDNDDACWDEFYANGGKASSTTYGETDSSDIIPKPCGDNDDVCWDAFYANGGTVSSTTYGGTTSSN